MMFSGDQGQEVELVVHSYAHTLASGEEWDNNWLRVFLRVRSDHGTWQVEDPCLLTWELAAFSDWLVEWSRNEPLSRNPLGFVEPNLCFERRERPDGRWVLRIGFDLEYRPPGAADEADYYIDCPVDADTLRRLVQDVQQQQRAFPVR